MIHKYIFTIYSVVIFLFLFSSLPAQSPWVHPAQKGYSHIALGLLPSYDQVFNGNINNLADIEGEISEISIQSYTEVGLGKNLGLVLSVPYNMISSSLDMPTSSGRVEGSVSGFGNAELGVKYNFFDQGFILSGQLSLNLPLASQNIASGLQTGYDAAAITPNISAGKGWSQSYVFGYVGHEFTSNDLNDNLKLGVEYGYKWFSRFWTIAAFNMKEPTTTTDKSLDDRYEETRSFVNNQYYNSLSIKLIYEFNEHFGINGSSNLISVRANNLPFQAPFALGVWRKW